jgi:hypothetical protein
VGKVAADRAGLGAHRDRLQAHATEGAQVGDEHLVVGMAGGGLVHVEGIGVLHQELAPAHHAEAGALLVPELPLDVVEVLGQVLVAAHVRAEDLGDHLLVGRAIEQLALVPVGDAQHLRAIGVVPSGLPPQVGQLQRGHEHGDGPCPRHLLVHNLLDLLEHAVAQRQPGIDAGRLLADHAGPEHVAVRDDLGLGRGFLEDRQEEARQAHTVQFRQNGRARHLALRRAPLQRSTAQFAPGAGAPSPAYLIGMSGRWMMCRA